MAFATSVNDQPTDSVTQTSVEVLGSVPAVATGNLMTATSDALSLAALNASFAQQNMNAIAQTSTAVGTAILLSLKPKPKA